MNARPEVTAPTRWAFPEPETTTLSNGLTVQLYDVPGQYVLASSRSRCATNHVIARASPP